VRYTPAHRGKKWLWEHLFQRHLAWRDHEAVARTVFGARMRLQTHDLVQRCIYHYGVWEPNLTQWISERLRPSDVFVDVGANCGYFTLLGASCVGPGGSVVAVEPSPAIASLLRENLERNHARNVRVAELAVSDHRGEVRLFSGPRANSGMTTTVAADRTEGGIAVPCMPLPDCLSEHELKRARVIKIDVEGAEWSVLTGLAPAFAKLRPDCEIVVEISPDRLRAQGVGADEVLAFMKQHGYGAMTLPNDYSPNAYFHPRPQPPEPIVLPMEADLDIVFTRAGLEQPA
jgi:FkbM family methyltransferase